VESKRYKLGSVDLAKSGRMEAENVKEELRLRKGAATWVEPEEGQRSWRELGAVLAKPKEQSSASEQELKLSTAVWEQSGAERASAVAVASKESAAKKTSAWAQVEKTSALAQVEKTSAAAMRPEAATWSLMPARN